MCKRKVGEGGGREIVCHRAAGWQKHYTRAQDEREIAINNRLNLFDGTEGVCCIPNFTVDDNMQSIKK